MEDSKPTKESAVPQAQDSMILPAHPSTSSASNSILPGTYTSIPLPKALKGRYAHIAQEAGLTRPHVSRVLRGETRDPSADVVRKIARSMSKLLEMNISTDDLLDYLEERQKEARERAENDMRPHIVKVRKLKRLGKSMREIEEETGVNRTTASGVR